MPKKYVRFQTSHGWVSFIKPKKKRITIKSLQEEIKKLKLENEELQGIIDKIKESLGWEKRDDF